MKDGVPISDAMISTEGNTYESDHEFRSRGELFGRPLSSREREIMLLQGQGQSLNEIAKSIGISRNTTNVYVRRLHEKIGVETSVEMIIKASEMGLIDTAQLVGPDFDPAIFNRLTPKEKEISRLLTDTGFTNKEIATAMEIDEDTVKKHMFSIFDKTGNRKRIQLVVGILEARRRGLGLNSDEVKDQKAEDLSENIELTPRQSQLVQLISQGMTHKEIAYALNIGIHSVRNYTTAMYRKWGINTQAALMKKASELRLIDTTQLVGPDFNPDVFKQLTAREMQIVDLITDRGLTDKEVAHELNIRRQTVARRLIGIFAATGFSSRVELVVGVLEFRRRVEAERGQGIAAVEVQIFPAV